MKRIVRGRDTGKTRELLEECSRNNGVFVCKHPERVLEKCLAYHIPTVKALGYDEFDSVPSDSILYVDELEEFIQHKIILKLGGYSLTTEDTTDEGIFSR